MFEIGVCGTTCILFCGLYDTEMSHKVQLLLAIRKYN